MCCVTCCCLCFFKQKTAYEMRISDWSSDVCSSDLPRCRRSHSRVPLARIGGGSASDLCAALPGYGGDVHGGHEGRQFGAFRQYLDEPFRPPPRSADGSVCTGRKPFSQSI